MRNNHYHLSPLWVVYNVALEKVLLSSLLFLVTLVASSQNRFEYTYSQMGTQIRWVLYTENEEKADSVSTMVFERIDELNLSLSDYLDESELNQLGRKGFQTVQVGEDLYRILKAATEISTITMGAFDVTVGPLTKLWREARNRKILPNGTDLAKAKHSVGYGLVQFPGPGLVQLKAKGMQLDLGGIGKGYTADEIIAIFESHGIHSALVDLGGDIRVSGPPPDRAHWVIAFSYSDKNGKEQLQKVKLTKGAVATSGDRFQFVEIDGVRYSHIIDPRTGMALSDRVQVTVIGKDATTADAFASAFGVLGFDEVKKRFNEWPTLEVFMTNQSQTGYQQWKSPGFEACLIKD